MQILGRNPVLEVLKSEMKLKKILVKQGDLDIKLQEIIDLANKKGVSVSIKSKKYLNKISEHPLHQGVIAIAEDVRQPGLNELLNDLERENIEPFLVFVRDAQNEANIGAIIRTAEAAGAHALLLPPKLKVSPVMVRSSMGATAHLPVINTNLFQSIKEVQNRNIRVVGIEMNGTKFHYEETLKGPLMLIVGGEDKSLSKELQDKCDAVVKIPMKGKVNSLNMSVAAAIVIYEKLRQEA
jgi:23S rRNA (guanosine2251-2'-O)-methyltransferase